jgi:hypothetical protein
MAAPNIVQVGTITAKTAYLTPANATSNVLLANAASSGKVFKVNMIIAANIDGTSAYDTTVAVNTAAAGSGTSYPLASTVSVPADASLIVSDKSTAFYLEEDKSVVVTSSTSSKIAYTISYEELSQ